MKKILLFLALFSMGNAFAKNLGIYGKTYLIAETDFLEFIQKKMQSLQTSGKWEQIQTQFKKRVEAHITRPHPTHLPRAQEDKSWLFDPSIKVPDNIYDHQGLVIVKGGAIVNPLDTVSLHSTLLFFDGDDLEQIEWIKKESKKEGRGILILTSGSIKTTTAHLKQAVFFDLNAFLIQKFHIRALPAKVLQDGKKLRVCEVSI
jgi:conjugal transfer pilus assembly protein TraW